ncbi:MAG: OmpA family protein [Nitrospira sp.]|nr:OmpA family protein [Nitrospira sp.]
MMTTTLVRQVCIGFLVVGPASLWGASYAQPPDPRLVRYGEAALTFASGAIQKATPRDGIVNLVTGDSQSAGNRMLLGLGDTLYLKLENPTSVAVGDLFTVYRRVRKAFHPLTKDYLGFVTIRVAVVKVTDLHPTLITAKTVVSYGPIVPGDLVTRFVAPSAESAEQQERSSADVEGIIVEIQVDKPMTVVSQSNIVYLDRGKADGLRTGDILDLYRQNAALPMRKIGELKVLATEDHTATARIIKASTRVFKGDRFKRAGTPAATEHTWGVVLPSDPSANPPGTETDLTAEGRRSTSAASIEFVAKQLGQKEASDESRVNLDALSHVLYYDSGETVIKPEGRSVLDRLIAYLAHNGDRWFIRVEGHTDNVEIGPSLKKRYPTNMDLARARAENIVHYLVGNGRIEPSRVTTIAYGESKPAATNANEEGRRKNRRVEILLYEPSPAAAATDHDHASVQHPSLSANSTQEHERPITAPLSPLGSDTGTFSFHHHDPATRHSILPPTSTTDSLDAPSTAPLSDPPSSAVGGTDFEQGASWPIDSLDQTATPTNIDTQAHPPDSSGS